MINTLVVDAILALLVLGLGVWMIVTPRAYSAAVGFVAYGLLLALVWVRLAAVDVALTEAALGSGLTGLLLLGAAGRMAPDAGAEVAAAPGPLLRLLIGVACALLAAGLAAVVLLSGPAPSMATAVARDLPATGVLNPITGVLLSFRAIDTLLETVVLVPALIGVWSLALDRDWGGRSGSLSPLHPNSPLTLVARVLPPFGILVAIHLVWIGADEPGGKFQGAAVLAAMWVLVLMAGLREPPAATSRALRLALVFGPLVFIGIGLSGVWLAGAFLAYPDGYAKPMIIAIEAALTLSVAVVLGLLLAGPPKNAQRTKGRE